MGISAEPRSLLEEPPSGQRPLVRLPAADEVPIAVSKAGGQSEKRVDKKSLDYLIRSGVAGGLSGCAVSMIRPTCVTKTNAIV